MSDQAPFDLMQSAWEARRAASDLRGPEREKAISSIVQDLSEAATTLRRRDLPVAYAHALHLQAHVEWDRGEPEAAESLWEESVSVLRQNEEPLQLAHKVRHLGDIRFELGHVREAADHYEEALSLYRSHDDPPKPDLANAVRRMAVLKEQVGDAASARALWSEARERYAALDLQEGVSEAEQHLSTLG